MFDSNIGFEQFRVAAHPKGFRNVSDLECSYSDFKLSKNQLSKILFILMT